MVSDIQRPDWLTDELIEKLREEIKNCDNPYTHDEFRSLPFDGGYSPRRYNAMLAHDIFVEYGIDYE